MDSRLRDAACPVAAVGAADVRRHPDPASELVTQALLNAPARVLERSGAWTRVELADYSGWVRADHLAPAPDERDAVAVVLEPRVPIRRDASGGEASGFAYATTVLPVADDAGASRVRVLLPGGRHGWLDGHAVALRPAAEPLPYSGPEVAVELALRLLDVPYLWGGTTVEGIDCSGLVQLCCRAAGVTIPRDADQQYEGLDYIVGRGQLERGDLLFFAFGGAITHVGMMLDGRTYVHARGEPHSRVMLSSLGPGDDAYDPELDQAYAGARRPFPGAAVRRDGDEDAR